MTMGVRGWETDAERVLWADKFAERVQRGDGCWTWTGSKLPTGYGMFFPAEKVHIYAHRFAWSLANGCAVPPGLHIMHSCDNPSCVRPEHLSAGTHSDNMRDCVSKGRNSGIAPKGEDHHNHVLSAADVLEIRRRRAGGEPTRSLVAAFKVSRTQIKFIIARKAWKHI